MAFKWTLEVSGDPRSFVIDPTRGAINWLTAKEAAERAKDISPIADAVYDTLLDEHKRLVSTKGGHIGHPWPDYTADERKRYVPWKIKKVGDVPPMFWSPVGAKLIPSIIGHGENHVWKVTKNSFEYGTDLPYAKGHHEGTGYAKKWMGGYRVPRRKLIGVSQGGNAKIMRTLQRYIVTGQVGNQGISGVGGVR